MGDSAQAMKKTAPTETRIEWMDIDKIPPHPENPKAHDLPAIMASMRAFGFRGAVILDERSGLTNEGHGRVEALKLMRSEDARNAPKNVRVEGNVKSAQKSRWLIPVVRGQAFANEDEARAFLIASNRLTEIGGWNAQVLSVLYASLAESTPDLLPSIGIGSAEIDAMLAAIAPELDMPTAEDEAPAPPSRPVSKLGDIWTFGKHTLLCGSCEGLLAIVGERCAKIMVTDPPYGVSYAGKNKFLNAIGNGNRIQTPIAGDHMAPQETLEFLARCFLSIRPLLLPGAAYYVTSPQGGEMQMVMMQALSRGGFPLRHQLIWAKNGIVFGRSDYHYQHEPILYGWVDGAAHHAVSDRTETSLWQIDKPRESTLHPTMKPVELYRRAIRNSSDRGDTLLDPFGGSGTAWIAAHELDRVCVGSEISPAYCDVIVERWQLHTGEKATRKRSAITKD